MKSFFHLQIASLMICCSLFFLTGCGQKKSNVVQLAPLPESICRVAVLPISNKSEYQDGGILFYRIFVSELAGLGNFQITAEGDVRQAFRQVRLLPGLQDPTHDQLRIIGDYLDADIMIAGTILEMSEVSVRGGEIIPNLTIRLDIHDAASGKKLWSIYHRRDGGQYRKVMHFGVITSITQLAKQISREILTSLISKGFIKKCIE